MSKESAREFAVAASRGRHEAQGVLQRSLGKLLHGHARNLRQNLFMPRVGLSQPMMNRNATVIGTGEFIQKFNDNR